MSIQNIWFFRLLLIIDEDFRGRYMGLRKDQRGFFIRFDLLFFLTISRMLLSFWALISNGDFRFWRNCPNKNFRTFWSKWRWYIVAIIEVMVWVFVMMKIYICFALKGSNKRTNRSSSRTRATTGGTFMDSIAISIQSYVRNTELCLIIHFKIYFTSTLSITFIFPSTLFNLSNH